MQHNASTTYTTDNSQPKYLGISVTRLVCMNILTSGLYDCYWFYKNWQIIKLEEKSNISPFWRSVFSIFFVYSLFNKIGRKAIHCSGNYDLLKQGKICAYSYILCRITVVSLVFIEDIIPDAVICGLQVFHLCMIIPMQQSILSYLKEVIPNYKVINYFSKGEKIFISIGIFLWISIIIILLLELNGTIS